ncbi:MAG: gliding motility lipoprotein GldD [Bacteroidia bacterium]|nr:gliding motility lipoprotein GldD [Bacteroidia bacterium]
MDIPVSTFFSNLLFINSDALLSPSVVAGFLAVLVLLFLSALIAAAEVGFFSLVPSQISQLKNTYTPASQRALQLLEKPKKLLATIVVAHNLVNVGVIVISETLFHVLFDFAANPTLGFLVQVVVVTFLILLIGEVIPKIYSTQNALNSAIRLVYFLIVLQKVLWPLSSILIYLTSIIESRIKQRGHNISVDDLSHALELTSNEHTPEQEQKILKGIVEFGNTEVRQIMKARMDVVAFDVELDFEQLIASIVESGFSRVPVYKDSLDNVQGILYIKDLLAHLDENAAFNWKTLVRPALFVPENKKIDDLMKEFQTKKNHLAVVVDEYGGTCGIVTLEDIIEEVVGDIKDEFDEDELTYSKLDEFNYVFEGKILLNDLYRVLSIEAEEFEEVKGDSDTLAGFILELAGKIPNKFEKIVHREYVFEIESVDKRRIKRVKITLPKREKDKEESNEPRLFNNKLTLLFPFLLLSSFYFTSCESEYTPKPKGYFRIDFPKKEYITLSSDCPFSFAIPVYSKAMPYTGVQQEKCWMNLDFPTYRAKIHLSYFDLHADLTKHLEDSRSLAYKHTVKADGIEETPFINPVKKVYGLVYSIEGNAASSLQFYITDSVSHFVRGALYFNAAPNSDSTAPVLKFIKADVTNLIETFEWK